MAINKYILNKNINIMTLFMGRYSQFTVINKFYQELEIFQRKKGIVTILDA
jgi:hypothetical protein